MTARVSCTQLLNVRGHGTLGGHLCLNVGLSNLECSPKRKWPLSVPWTQTFKNWVQNICAVIFIPMRTWHAWLMLAKSYSSSKFFTFGIPWKAKFTVRSYDSAHRPQIDQIHEYLDAGIQKAHACVHRGRNLNALHEFKNGCVFLRESRDENKNDFTTSKVKKTNNLTIDLYLWVYMPRDPKLWLTDPKLFGEFESELFSEFWARNAELKGSGVSNTEGHNSPFGGC